MKLVTIKHAEVVPQYGSENCLFESKLDGGKFRFSWNIKTKVNDKINNSPLIFDKCSMFVDSAEKAETIRNTIRCGVRLEIEGICDKNKGKDSKGEVKYYDQINVKKFTPYNDVPENKEEEQELAPEQQDEDDLPF